MAGRTLLQPHFFCDMGHGRRATLKPYKHQITQMGRVDVVVFAENFFFCAEKIPARREGKPRRERPDLPCLYPGMLAAQAKIKPEPEKN